MREVAKFASPLCPISARTGRFDQFSGAATWLCLRPRTPMAPLKLRGAAKFSLTMRGDRLERPAGGTFQTSLRARGVV